MVADAAHICHHSITARTCGELMRRSHPLAALAILSLVASFLAACSPEVPASSDTVAVVAGEEATLTVADVTVTLPAGSFTGNGTLSVTPEVRDGHDGYDIKLADGATLTGEATITFAGSPSEGEPAPLVTYQDDAGTYAPADNVTLNGSTASTTTTHFSFWFVTWWKDLVDGVKRAWQTAFSPSDASALACKGEASEYTLVKVSEDKRGAACLGMGANYPELQVRNERSYPVVIESTSHLVIQNQDKSWESQIQQLLPILLKSSDPSVSLYAMSAKQKAVYNVTSRDVQGVEMYPSGAAYAGDVLKFALETVTFILGATGVKGGAKAVEAAFNSVGCVDSFGKMASSNISNLDDLRSYLDSSASMALDCAGDIYAKVGGAQAGIAGVLASGVLWIVHGADLLTGAVQAVGDFATNWNNSYVLNTKGQTADSVPPGSGLNEYGWLISSEGIGPLKLGMPLSDAEDIISYDWAAVCGQPSRFSTPNRKDVILFDSANDRVTGLIWVGKEADGYDAATADGIRLGMTTAGDLGGMGYTGTPAPYAQSDTIFRWDDAGVPMFAVTSPDTLGNEYVTMVGVGVSQVPHELCS